jgi:hypothetical protein
MILPSTLNLSGGAVLSGVGNLDILSTNTVNVNGATLQGLSTGLNVNNQGSINVASGQALVLDNASLSNAASGALSGPGELMISFGSDFSSGGTVDVARIFLDGGTLTANSFDYAGDLIWDSGTVDGSGTGLTTSGDVSLVQGSLNTDWTITPAGTVTWQGSDINSLTIASNATITNQGTFTIESFVDTSEQLRTEAKNLYGLTGAAFINQGTLVIDADAFPGVASADTVVFSLDFTNDNGTIAIKSGTFRIENGSGVQQDLVLDQAGDSLQGFGTFDGNVVNQAGTVSPGRSDTTNGVFTTGTLTITGDFIQQFDGDLIIKMDSTASGLLNDTLVVEGQLAAGGDVKFAVVNGKTPTQLALLIDQSFKPLEFGTLAGRFDTVEIPPGLNFTFSDTGVISISSDSPLLNNIASQIEALFENNDLSFAQIIRAMRSIDRGVRAEFGDSDEEGDERAPRLVCR